MRAVKHAAVGTVGSASGSEEVTLEFSFENGETLKARIKPDVARIVAGAIETAVKSIEEERTNSLRRWSSDS